MPHIRNSFLVRVMPLLLMSATGSYAADGELWETRSAMEGAAFGRMDLGVSTECRPANWRDNPTFKAPGDGECKAQTLERSGNRYAWQFECGKTKGAGSMRATGADHLEGEMQMDTPDGHFVLKLESRRLGSCTRETQG